MRFLLLLTALSILLLPAPSVDARSLLRADLVLVKKADRRLYLIRHGEPFRVYPISLGFEPVGHKVRAGDGRTPEGRYVIDWRNPESRFHKSLHINYPNAADLQLARALGVDPGGMIMIHGESEIPVLRKVNAGRDDWTEGCIAVSNEAIEEIWYSVPDGTPIEIHP
jgi:murein L,D-transpeptidase YafK